MSRAHGSLFVVVLVVGLLVPLSPLFALTADDVLRLKGAGFSEVMITKIVSEYAEKEQIDAAITLKEQGLSEDVITAALQAMTQQRQPQQPKRRVTANDLVVADIVPVDIDEPDDQQWPKDHTQASLGNLTWDGEIPTGWGAPRSVYDFYFSCVAKGEASSDSCWHVQEWVDSNYTFRALYLARGPVLNMSEENRARFAGGTKQSIAGWSPDGEWFYYAVGGDLWRAKGALDKDGRIRALTEKIAAKCTQDRLPGKCAMSPDGSVVAIVAPKSWKGGWVVNAVDAAGGPRQPRLLCDLPSKTWPTFVAWSPSGKSLAVVAGGPKHKVTLYVLHLQ
jgi:hypothetical protein